MTCHNCGQPVTAHCRVHTFPCCPGKCPGAVTLADAWAAVRSALPADFPPQVQETMEHLFYAGASSALTIISEGGPAAARTALIGRVARLLKECAEVAKPKVRLT